MSIPKLIDGAASQYFPGNNIGCLILHGFMASPGEVGWLGQHLANIGYTVYIPRLAGHGIDPKHMDRIRWEDWYSDVLDGYAMLRGHCDQVIAIGHSMGGLLSIHLAVSESLDGLVLAATPLTINDPRVPYTRLLRFIRPYTYHLGDGQLNVRIEAEQQRRGEPVVGRVHYAAWSTRAVYEFYRLLKAARQQLPHILIPTLVLWAQKDVTATSRDRDIIVEKARHASVKQYMLTKGQHIVFQDEGREEAFAVVADFIANCIEV